MRTFKIQVADDRRPAATIFFTGLAADALEWAMKLANKSPDHARVEIFEEGRPVVGLRSREDQEARVLESSPPPPA
jgi:hypothetical protein